MACTLMQFGGTTLTGLLLGQTPSWILSHQAFPALLLAWWLTFCCPLDFYYTLMRGTGIFGWVTMQLSAMGACISAGHAVTSWGMDKALWNTSHANKEKIASSMITCVLSGTFSACGGAILTDVFGLLRTKNAFTLTETPDLFKVSPPEFPENESSISTRSSLFRAFLCSSTCVQRTLKLFLFLSLFVTSSSEVHLPSNDSSY